MKKSSLLTATLAELHSYMGMDMTSGGRIKTSKYKPHQGAKECERRRKQYPEGMN